MVTPIAEAAEEAVQRFATERWGERLRRPTIISRTFKEVSEMLLTDPDVQDALRRRVLLELAGRKRNPLPLVAVLVDLQKRAMARKEDRDLVLGGFSLVVALRYFALAKKLAGITRRFRFHDLRHSFASRHAAAGTPLQIIQKMMGHASIKMTERYSRVDVNAVKAAVRALDRNSSLAANSSANSSLSGQASAASGVSGASDSKKAG
jgi:integrase